MAVSQSQISSAQRQLKSASEKRSRAAKKRSDASIKASRLRQEASRTSSAQIARTKLAQAQKAEQDANAADVEYARADRDVTKHSSALEDLRTKQQQEQTKNYEQALRRLERTTKTAEAQFGVREVSLTEVRRSAGFASRNYDFFLSHASEDKDEIARPLAEALRSFGHGVWFDENNIRIGESIRQKIEAGLSSSRYGIVILSEWFFKKHWTQAELDALFNLKVSTGENVILPIWHKVSKDQVQANAPLLSGLLALNSSTMTIEEMATELHMLIENNG